MYFGGMVPVTLIDYPGVLACTIFTTLCNFSCPFCHNYKTLVNGELQQENFSENDVLLYLEKRKKLIKGVVVSGGEPCIDYGLPEFLERVKELGFLIKLDTNGSKPDMVKKVVEQGLVDYIAMDIKNSFDKYQITAGLISPKEVDEVVTNVKRSIDYIMTCGIDYEFRTTVLEDFHTAEDMHKIGSEIYGAKKYYIQQFRDTTEVKTSGLTPLSYHKLYEFRRIMEDYVNRCDLRI